MSASEDLGSRLHLVQDRIEKAAARSGRGPGDVTLVAVSKTQPTDVILSCIEAGAADLGENRAQELKQKHAVLGDRARWHFIGHLQTNKVRQVAGAARLIHSVDRYGVAEAISTRAQHLGIVQEVLIEVNVSGEAAKHGIDPPRLGALAEEIASLEGLKVTGLMTMAPLHDDAEASRPYFAELRDLLGVIRLTFPEAHHLSMGMTRDFEVAIEEGATIVRVGEAIFGPRR